jgi:hypothetical protein
MKTLVMSIFLTMIVTVPVSAQTIEGPALDPTPIVMPEIKMLTLEELKSVVFENPIGKGNFDFLVSRIKKTGMPNAEEYSMHHITAVSEMD